MTESTIDREKVALFMGQHGFATGHGDTIDDLLGEMGAQIEELRLRCAGLRAEGDALSGAVMLAEQTFQQYGDLHAAKPDMIKANRNYELAHQMRAALDSCQPNKH